MFSSRFVKCPPADDDKSHGLFKECGAAFLKVRNHGQDARAANAPAAAGQDAMTTDCLYDSVMIFDWLKRKKTFRHTWKIKEYTIDVYPSSRSCIKQNMSHVRPQQMPPLMVRKAAWRR